MPSALATQLGKLKLGGGSFPAQKAGAGPSPIAIPGYLRYRLLDPVSGAVVVPDLPHLHQSKWEVKGFQYGASGGSAIGAFEIPLHPPLSPDYEAAAQDYAKIAYGQRVEGYPGDVFGGNPKFSGVIRQVPTGLTKYAIKGVDSLNLLEQAKTFRTEFLTLSSDGLARRGMQGWTGLNFGDDFSSGSLSGYTLAGAGLGAHPWTAGTDEGFTCVNGGGGAASEVYMLSTASIASYANTISEAYFHLGIPARAGAGFIVSPGLIVAATDGSNFWLMQVYAQEDTASGRTAVFPAIWQKTAGTYTLLKQGPVIAYLQVTGAAATDLRYILQVVGTYVASTQQFTWRVLVNGIDVNCTYTFTTATPPSGPIGLRMDNGSVSLQNLHATQLVNRALVNLFQPGNVSAGSRQIQQLFSRVGSIEFLNIAATMESWAWRKNAGAGLNQDTIDFGPSPGVVGTDLSTAVRFEEGVNLAKPEIVPQVEPLTTHLELSASAGNSSSGYVSWPNIPAIRKFGWLTDAVNGPQLADFLTTVRLAQQLATIRGAPGTAKKFTVIRDETSVDAFRELDFITVHAPSIGLLNQKVQVLTYTWQEGSAEMHLVCDKYPLGSIDMAIRRFQDAVDALATGHSSLTPSTVGLIFDGMLGSPNVLAFYSGLQTGIANGGVARCRFHIPANVIGIQQVLVSMNTVNAGNHGLIVNGVDRTSAAKPAGPYGNGDVGPINITQWVTGYPAWNEVQVQNNTGTAADIIIFQVQVYATVKPQP